LKTAGGGDMKEVREQQLVTWWRQKKVRKQQLVET
jgi:hypothetical protein